MFQSMITAVNSDEGYTEIVRAVVEGRYLKPVFSVLKLGSDSLEEASRVFEENNSLPADEIFVTAFHPKDVVFQHLEVPRVKSVKNLVSVASFKAASQFSLPPDEVNVACLNSLSSLRTGLVPAFIITKKRALYEFIGELTGKNFPEPNIVDVKPFSIFKIAQTSVFEGNNIVFIVDKSYSLLLTLRGEEIVGLNYINDGFDEVASDFKEDNSLSPNTNMQREFLIGSKAYYDSLIEEASERLESMISYQLRMYLTNTLSNSPNTSAADESLFNRFFVAGQSSLSTAVYSRAFQQILGTETEVASMPLKMKETSGITYTSAGLLMRGGELLGRRKLVFKEEAGLKT
ncbi:hypothetical protein Theba_0715 [Mesotoga prima MesG1.Ag.4.2]|uniref:Tfp pilus assembly protein, ATPase PilM n=1 Tax=Mesotoga prima MesG1.Ag.4.2 TaxID=660470 RepID=I2F3C9_9BACT|nr:MULTISPECIES: hypothetical protein [Mesotoga]AFK06432.1 hypothetical protein Theba_0715 [Mesotoga prima MesG1.Ag.4.2]PIJ62232.1 hypothetical protein V513_06370 [Mesotoga sp. H07.pep.5.3]HNQ69976.1 hypothetical protein [Mesotoga prima]HNS74983.1 hypothetical protein [Mesotoga prima]